MSATLRFIGRIRTPYRSLSDCPRNIDPDGPVCELSVDEACACGLTGLEAGQEILVLYWLGAADRDVLLQQRREDDRECGVFALRSPNRPNPIGAGVVRIERIADGCLQVRGLDCLDGTPLLDIKPALPARREGNSPDGPPAPETAPGFRRRA